MKKPFQSLLPCIFFLLDVAHALQSVVVYGPQSRELLLLTAKLAARSGLDTSLVCAPGTETGCRRLMYGKEYAEADIDAEGNAKPICTGDDMEAALQRANALLLIGYDSPIEQKSLATFLSTTSDDQLSKIVLLSKMGVSSGKGGGGFFGGGGGNSKLTECEKMIRQACQDKGLDLSIVRAGTVLKGGGPGDFENGCDFGLDRCYYNTVLDVVEAKVTMAHDRYTLGADVSPGDTVEIPNMFTQMGSKSSFDPCPYESNRVVVAGAIVAAALYDQPVELSVGAEAGREPLTNEAWNDIFSKLK